ncbi:hypothetical protein RvY_01059-1 [Ramazzottius varieornatus]|uniref:Uncharacterized protein n=1 Tax=Ramazzottius varieornatus TaxID=947166 RepID=A0A1D1UM58_RAMVA|nr:hypothetical protein RvY_01059-1 [Ramazzottius varieornatus]
MSTWRDVGESNYSARWWVGIVQGLSTKARSAACRQFLPEVLAFDEAGKNDKQQDSTESFCALPKRAVCALPEQSSEGFLLSQLCILYSRRANRNVAFVSCDSQAAQLPVPCFPSFLICCSQIPPSAVLFFTPRTSYLSRCSTGSSRLQFYPCASSALFDSLHYLNLITYLGRIYRFQVPTNTIRKTSVPREGYELSKGSPCVDAKRNPLAQR